MIPGFRQSQFPPRQIRGVATRHGDIQTLMDFLIAVEYEYLQSAGAGHRGNNAVERQIGKVYRLLDNLLGYPLQDPSPTMTVVHDIVHGGVDQERLDRIVKDRGV